MRWRNIVSSKATDFDKAFLNRKRQQLVKLRDDLAKATQGRENDETLVNTQAAGEAQESEDDAQRLTMLELDGNLMVRDIQRLALVNRALQKIDDGTYGFSDASGDPIPVERLEVMPEAIYTVAEQEAREPDARQGSTQR
jgi:DnaK suppressor protein